MSKLIPLTKGYFAIVDDADYDWLMQWSWHVLEKNNGKHYAVRSWYDPSTKKTKNQFMHRLINNTPEGLYADHKNNNGLDNQRLNLRDATCNQNNHNGSAHKNTSSKFKGVAYTKRDERWEAYIHLDSKKIRLGLYKKECDAAQAYNFAALDLFKDFAKFNTTQSDIGTSYA